MNSWPKYEREREREGDHTWGSWAAPQGSMGFLSSTARKMNGRRRNVCYICWVANVQIKKWEKSQNWFRTVALLWRKVTSAHRPPFCCVLLSCANHMWFILLSPHMWKSEHENGPFLHIIYTSKFHTWCVNDLNQTWRCVNDSHMSYLHTYMLSTK